MKKTRTGKKTFQQNFRMPWLERPLAWTRLYVRTEHLRSHWTDFHEILYLRISQKSVEKIQFSLKTDKNKRKCIRKITNIYDIIARLIILKIINVSEQIKTKFYIQHFSENPAVYEKMWKIRYSLTGPHMTIQYGAWDFNTGKERQKDTHTLRIRNTCSFSMSATVTWPHANVTLYVYCLSC